jgi:lysophospholipase L1-like esterase
VRLAKLIDITREQRSAPVLITQPALFGDAVDPTTRLDLSRFAFQDMDGITAWSVLELYNEATRRVAAEAGVPLIDLAREMPKDSIYFYDGIHFTNAGARAVSEIISRSLCPIMVAKFPSFRGTADDKCSR